MRFASMSTEQSESAPAVTAPQVETAPAVTAPQVENKAAPAADVTQQATTPTATTQRVKNPRRVAAGKMVAQRTRLAREEQRRAAEVFHAKAATAAPEPAPTTKAKAQRAKAQIAAAFLASARTNGLVFAALAFHCLGFITNVKSSWRRQSPCSTN